MDYSAEVAIAADSEALANALIDKLFGAPVSATLKAEAKAAIERIPASSPGLRVSEALYLLVTSPEYAVQR